jgi:hypothetical protein
MTLDNETHRQFLLEIIKQSQFPGHLLDLAYDLKTAIQKAETPALTQVIAENKAVPTMGGL